MKVLVTDDDADSRELVRLTPRHAQDRGRRGRGGTECLQVAQETRPDAILLDVMMPFMDGPTTLSGAARQPGHRLHPRDLPDRLRDAVRGRAAARRWARAPWWPSPSTPSPSRRGAGAPRHADPRPPSAAPHLEHRERRLGRAARAVRDADRRRASRCRRRACWGCCARRPKTGRTCRELMRFFHSLGRVGTSSGFPGHRAGQGRRAPSAWPSSTTRPRSPTPRSRTGRGWWARWPTKLSQPPTTSAGGGRAGMVTRIPVVCS